MSSGKCTASVSPLSLDQFALVFWDFDGVIKESVEVKTSAFEALFRSHGSDVAARVREHNERNGGSRFEKIPLYLGWAGVPVTDALVADYCRQFSDLALRGVIEAAWVPGVREYLERHRDHQDFVLLTATPQDEIEQILDELDLARYFGAVFGAPTPKSSAIATVIRMRGIDPQRAVMVGDTETDLLAARDNGVQFLLRRTPGNSHLHAAAGIHMCDDFTRWTDAR